MAFVISVLNKPLNQTSKHCCSSCDKKYTNKSSLYRHQIVCEIANKPPREKLIEGEEEGDLPTYKQLVIIVQELTKKCSSMEKKMTEMQKWVQRTKKKIDVIQWLNTSSSAKPHTSFTEWFQNLTINAGTIDILMENTMYQTLATIFAKNLPEDADNPVCSFCQKQGSIYIYEMDGDAPTWKLLSREQFTKGLNRLHLKILNELLAWKEKNEEKIENDDKLAEKYNKTMMKLMGINFTQEHVYSKIKGDLFSYVKKDIKNILEYEVEF
uniref:C2H2-type domain-containing protein n=1 Tax=viral metagenome TaxID=1070528 RepID=A0A6C0F2P2_9ZZZZ